MPALLGIREHRVRLGVAMGDKVIFIPPVSYSKFLIKYTGRLENDFTARGYLGDGLEFFPGLLRVPGVLVRVPPRVRSHCRFKNRGTVGRIGFC
jgi:hypothetical protein